MKEINVRVRREMGIKNCTEIFDFINYTSRVLLLSDMLN